MLLERDDLLQQLDDLARAADSRHGAIALVAGEAGIGKTTLLEEMRHRVSHTCEVFWGGCEALATPQPLGPIHDMAPALGNGVGEMLGRSAQPAELFDAILKRLENSSKPAVLVFEDIHWADHATLDFLKFIGRRASMLRMLLVLSYRSDEVAGDHPVGRVVAGLPHTYTHTIDIKPLSKQAVEALGASSGYVDESLYETTAGNPFFVTELIAWQDSARGSVPASVKDAVASRLNRL
ncbi:MAG: AAA family ATPase, partial [Woeseiaceae bacterium]|nr:AAA family ATPase [Woeseiaceae bacterium]